MGWPIARDSFEDVDDLFYDFTAEELGIDPKTAAKIETIKRLRPLSSKQPWGIFFIKFEPKKLPVVALRRILSQVALKKRASANSAERAAWAADDLLFVSNYGMGDERQISFAHFSKAHDGHDLPTLKVLGWDNLDTPLHLDAVAKELTQHLAWPADDTDVEGWRNRWRAAFTLRHREVITTSQDLSIRLAELAQAIRNRIRGALAIETEAGPLTKLMKAFQKSLVHDLDANGFADMYAQTIAYGLLSARIADPEKKTADDFAAHMRTNPFLRELMETFLKVGGRRGKAGGPGIDFDELGVSEVVELLDDANMEAVIRDFGDRNRQDDPVIHFYELFLSAYNKQLKVQRGVFYTPQAVVSYIVRSVHELLQSEFGLGDGLADTTTWGEMLKKHPSLGLPPLTDLPSDTRTISPDEPFVQILDPATGTATFLVEVIDVIHRTLAAKWKQQGLAEAEQRVAWNDYVPKHLLPRLHGYELMMAPYAIAHMKIGLKLYETGYYFGSDERARVYLTNALEPPQDFSDRLAFDAPALAHEAQAVNAIKRHQHFTVVIGNPPYSVSSQNDGQWIRGLCEDFKKGLDGERNIQPLSDDYIKFLSLALFYIEQTGLGLVGMITNREYIQGVIHRAIRKRFLESARRIDICDLHGQRGELLDEAYSTDENVFEIEKGVAINIMCFAQHSESNVKYGEIIGTASDKNVRLSTSISSSLSNLQLRPEAPYWFFKPWKTDFRDEYFAMPSLVQFFTRKPVTGFATHRDHFAIGFTKAEVVLKLEQFLDGTVSDAVVSTELDLKDTRDWHLHQARIAARRDRQLLDRIILCSYRPFDWRWVIYSDDILEYSRRDAMQHVSRKAPALICSRLVKDEIFAHVFVSKYPIEKIFLSPKSSNNAQVCLSGFRDELGASLIVDRTSLAVPGTVRAGNHQPAAEDLLRYLYAILHSPTYRIRYAEFLKSDFPRLSVTENLELFHALTRLGGEMLALHLLESPRLDRPISTYTGPSRPEIEKISHARETVWLDKAQTRGFRGVPSAVWNFHIGGYQVCEKWLKDRKGRTLSKDDIAHYQKIVVALAETIRLMKEIDEVIEAHGGWPGAFQPTASTDVRPHAASSTLPLY
jgi:predicted helicase